MMRRLINWFTFLAFLLTSTGVAVFFLFFYYGRGLPDYEFLQTYEPYTVSQILSNDGTRLQEFSHERRVPVSLDQVPLMVINSFLAAEDKNFFYHCGLDIQGIVRAVVTNSTQRSWSSRPLGGSTITQQIAKNFLVGNERSYQRKIKEAIMSLRLEAALSKERILELYLNHIYLGMGAYGIVAAASTYFNKSLDQLSLAEIAFLAAMPKAPSFYPNQKDLRRATVRRNWVIDRLLEEDVITVSEAMNAKAEPITLAQKSFDLNTRDYHLEHIRQEISHYVDEDVLKQGGLTVRTTINSEMQGIATTVLRQGLIAYDRRHGWRGPLQSLHQGSVENGEWVTELNAISNPPGLGEWALAVVLELSPQKAIIGLKNGQKGHIPLKELKWAKKNLPNQRLGKEIEEPEDVLNLGDIIAVSQLEGDSFRLEQIPEVTGGLIALNPHTGQVLAMVGGYDFQMSQFNCATQAKRQPGSAFKPFVYLTALEHGYTPDTRVLDAPLMLNVGGPLGIYAPKNSNNRFYGPTPLQSGLIYSRNVMTVRLAQQIGLPKIEKTAKAFGLVEKLPHQLAMALGAAETTLLKLTSAYGMIANGGFQIAPVFVEQIVDRHNQVLHEASMTEKIRVASPKSTQQILRMLVGVIQQGTGKSLLSLGRPIAGKTGSTNDHKDSWFVGFTPDLVVGVFVGFATPRTLGENEYGSKVAAPIFKSFMEQALKDKPILMFDGL